MDGWCYCYSGIGGWTRCADPGEAFTKSEDEDARRDPRWYIIELYNMRREIALRQLYTGICSLPCHRGYRFNLTAVSQSFLFLREVIQIILSNSQWSHITCEYINSQSGLGTAAVIVMDFYAMGLVSMKKSRL